MKLRLISRNIYVCAGLSFVSALFQFLTFYYNSWGRWKNTQVTYECLPLPPPIGCDNQGNFQSANVLNKSDTGFRRLSLLGSVMALIAGSITFIQNSKYKHRYPALLSPSARRAPSLLLFISACLSLVSCLIASFRMSLVSTVNKYSSLMKSDSMYPVISTSYYLAGMSSMLSLAACCIAANFQNDFINNPLKLSKTIKQHMSRDLMYPNDKHNQKMITFSSMASEMEEVAAEICVKATSKYQLEEDVAENIKKDFESKYGPIWHCIVGENFGSAVQHKPNEYVEISLPQISVLLFRCEKPKIVV